MYLCKDRAWTNQPIYGFNDKEGDDIPMRECYMLHVPEDMHVKVLALGSESDKRDYAIGEVKIEDIKQFKDE